MKSWRWLSRTFIALTTLAILLGASPAILAQEPPRGAKRAGLFGEVVAVEGNKLLVRTKRGDVSLSLTPDTDLRVRGGEGGTLDAIEKGKRIAVVVDQEDGVKIARSIMVISRRGNVVHSTGVVTATAEGKLFLATEEGSRIPVAFGLTGNLPQPGTVVTIVGQRDTEDGVLRARSFQRLEQTLDRLSSHLSEIQDSVSGGKPQIQRLERVRRLVERLNAKQLKLVNKVLERFPEEARPALDSALRNLEEANRAVAEAFDKALAVAGEVEREQGRPQRPELARLPKEIRPSLDDIAAALNLSDDDLSERLGQGKALAAIVQELGLTQQEFEEAVLARVHRRLQRLVEEGRLVPEAVELIADKLRDRVGHLVEQAFAQDTAVRPKLPVSMEDLAKILGIETPELHALLSRGVSVLHIAEKRGLSPDQLAKALADLARRRAEALAATGAVPAEDVPRLIEHIQKRIKQHIANPTGESEGSGEKPSTEAVRPRPGLTIRARPAPTAVQGVPFQLRAIAHILELPVGDVRERLSDGTTVAELAEDRGVPFRELIDALMASIKAKLRAMVEAGNMDKDQAEHLLEKARERLANSLKESRLSSGGESADRTAAGLSPSYRPYPHIPLTLKDLAHALDVSVVELRKWMGQKEGMRALLQERGMTPEDLAAALLSVARERIDEMEEAGEIPEEKVDMLLAKLKRRLLADLSGPRHKVLPQATAVRPAAKPVAYVPFDISRVADTLGISVEELRSLLSRGHSAADIATRRAVPLETLVRALLAPAEARVHEALEAETISEEDAKHKLEAARKAILQALQSFRLPGQDTVGSPRPDSSSPLVTVQPTPVPGAPEKRHKDEGAGDEGSATGENPEEKPGTDDTALPAKDGTQSSQ